MDTPIQYLDEHLLFGKVGHLLVITAFIFSLVSCAAYYLSLKNTEETNSWKSLARFAFGVHIFSILGIISIIFYIIYSHYFEYHYVWEHSSRDLPLRYIVSCFWEGQEGSFLLWSFWHVILSIFIIRYTGSWETPVMTVVSSVQVFLCSMLLGIYFLGYKVGSSPFILLREHPDMANLPFIQMPDYLSKIADGRGLNPLLQNYWMVIHPPILFLGFASTLIPFAFAIGGLLAGRFSEWVKPALPWTLFSIAALGTGVMMGAAWAYEALSFGGFWAWDPVENASLVPWLLIVGAAHVMLIYVHRGQSLYSTFILCIASFLLVLYSTFLTRSGILGDASVHAFTDLGMSGQLLVYMLFYATLSIFLLVKNRKKIPGSLKEEENVSSREFWMFIGMLVLVISSFQITLTTSLPVINKVFGTNFAPPVDAMAHYNAWQLPIAAILTFLLAIGQFFKWSISDTKEVMKRLFVSFIISIVITSLVAWRMEISRIHFIVLLFTSVFGFISNFDYLIKTIRGKMKVSGSSLAHAGFALLIVGVLISKSKSEVISQTAGVDFGKDLPANENIMLAKNDTVMMGDYFVTYKGKEKKGVNIFYEVEYLTYNWEKKNYEKEFALFPVIQTNPRMGNVSEPDTRHFLDKDIYTHITYADLKKEENPDSAYLEPVSHSIAIGDTIATNKYIIVLKGIERNIDKMQLGLNPEDFAVGAMLEITNSRNKIFHAVPVFIIKNNFIYTHEAELKEEGLKFNFIKIDPSNEKFELEIAEKKSEEKEFIIMKAIVFPYINILWTGAILMIIGTILAVRKRYLKLKKAK